LAYPNCEQLLGVLPFPKAQEVWYPSVTHDEPHLLCQETVC